MEKRPVIMISLVGGAPYVEIDSSIDAPTALRLLAEVVEVQRYHVFKAMLDAERRVAPASSDEVLNFGGRG